MNASHTPKPEQHPLSWQTLVSGFLGSVFGGVASLYAPDNVIFSATCTTLGCALLVLVNQKVGRSLSRWLMLVTALGTGVSFAYICVADPIKKGSAVFTTTAVKLKSTPGTHEAETIATLAPGKKLKYLGRTWRRYRLVRERSSYFDYWREVGLEDGQTGWIYGAYLTAEP